MGTRDGTIIAAIITIHMPMKEVEAKSQVWPPILIHAIDIVQPPGMGMPPDMERHHTSVPVALATNRSPLPARSAASRSVFVSVVMPDPGLRELEGAFVAPLRHQVEDVVGGVEQVDAARVARVGVEHPALLVL